METQHGCKQGSGAAKIDAGQPRDAGRGSLPLPRRHTCLRGSGVETFCKGRRSSPYRPPRAESKLREWFTRPFPAAPRLRP